MNLSTSTINSLAKYFFPFCQQLNFIFLLLPSKSIFHFFPPVSHGRRLLVCMLCGEKCSCKHWDVSDFFLRLCCRLHKTPRLLSRAGLVCGTARVCVVHFYFEERQGRRKHSERERMWKKQTENIVQVSAFTRHNS